MYIYIDICVYAAYWFTVIWNRSLICGYFSACTTLIPRIYHIGLVRVWTIRIEVSHAAFYRTF